MKTMTVIEEGEVFLTLQGGFAAFWTVKDGEPKAIPEVPGMGAQISPRHKITFGGE